MKKVLLLIGFAASGKSTIAKYLQEKFCYEIVEIGDIVISEYSQFLRKVNPIETTLLDFANQKMSQCGLDYFVKKIPELAVSNIVIVGIRTIEEFSWLKKKFPDLKSIKISASKSDRFLWEQKRKKKYENSIEMRDIVESSWGLEKTLNTADFEIINNGTIDELKNQIDLLLQTLEE